MTCKPRAGFTDPKLSGSPGLGQEKFCLDGLLLLEEKPEPSTFPSRPCKGGSQPTFPDWSLKPPAETGRSLLSPQACLVLSPHPLILYPKWPSHQSLLLNCYFPLQIQPRPSLLHEALWISAHLAALPAGTPSGTCSQPVPPPLTRWPGRQWLVGEPISRPSPDLCRVEGM